MVLFTRDINVQIEEIDANLIKATATMENKTTGSKKTGRFGIEVVLTKDTFEIKSVENVLIDGLLPVCCEVTPKLQSIVGLTVTSGYGKKVIEAAGGSEGCTHIVELLNEIARCVYQAHHGSILVTRGMTECVESFRKLSKIHCLGVSKYKE